MKPKKSALKKTKIYGMPLIDNLDNNLILHMQNQLQKF